MDADINAAHNISDRHFDKEISLYTPYSQPAIAAKWFTVPQLIYFSPVPILVIIFTVLTWRACLNRNEHKPFLYTLVLMFLAYSGFVITLWPNIIPPTISIWQAAAPEKFQKPWALSRTSMPLLPHADAVYPLTYRVQDIFSA